MAICKPGCEVLGGTKSADTLILASRTMREISLIQTPNLWRSVTGPEQTTVGISEMNITTVGREAWKGVTLWTFRGRLAGKK